MSGEGEKKKNPVYYAEQDLQVHQVYTDAQDARASLQSILDRHKAITVDVRQTEWAITDRELDVEGTIDPSSASSKTALQEIVKNTLKFDKQLVELRQKLRALKAEQSDLEHEARLAEWDIKIKIARMQELNGLLSFYAATKLKG